MMGWWHRMGHPSVLRWTKRIRRGGGWLTAVLLLAAVLTGCAGGGLRHESWPGLTAVDGTLYAANLGQVEALNAETGKLYWSFPAAPDKDVGPFYSTPVLVDDVGDHGLLLVAGYRDHTVYALALGASPAERPDELWRFADARGQFVGTGTVAEGLFLIGNGDGRVYALRLADGTKVWEFATRDRVWATPVVIGNTVYIASMDHHLYAVDLATGTEAWRIKAEGAITATPLYANGSLWFGDFASTLYRVDLDTREASWTLDVADWIWTTPVRDEDLLYFADVGGNVYALDTRSLTLRWSTSIDDAVRGRPALNSDGNLLFVAGFEKGRVHAIETSTGDLRQSWGAEPQNPGRLPGDLVADGERLYTMPILVDERVQAFALTSGELLWSAPAGN
jgi:eukaryotic-like serine/threonine-protein kinase